MEDLISQLPDELLQLILLKVPTRNSVMTSVLSTRWRNLWKGVPGLNLIIGDVYKNLNVKEFLDKFLVLHNERPIHQFTLLYLNKDYDEVHGFSLKWLVREVIARGLQCFAIDAHKHTNTCNIYRILKVPVSLFKCETLVHLWLYSVTVKDCEFINLPRLETMHLQIVWFYSEAVLEKLISCSPILQALSIRKIMGYFTLRSQSIKRLSLRRCSSTSRDGGVVIDIPSLEFLCIRDDPLEHFILENVSSAIKICIDIANYKGVADNSMSRMNEFRSFFAGSSVTDLTISRNTLEGLYPQLQLQELPNLENLTHLNACFSSWFSEMLPAFLSKCPNLKSLDLLLEGYPKTKKIAKSHVPQCFHTSLEYLEVKMIPNTNNEISRKAEIKFAEYILENATMLKKFTLWLNGEEDESCSVLKQIHTLPNRSVVEVKMCKSPAKFQFGYGYKFKPGFDPTVLFSYGISDLYRKFWYLPSDARGF